MVGRGPANDEGVIHVERMDHDRFPTGPERRIHLLNPNSWVFHREDRHHICNNRALFTEYNPLIDPLKVQVDHCEGNPIAIGIGVVHIPIWVSRDETGHLVLHNVYYVPKMRFSIVSFRRCTEGGFRQWAETEMGLEMRQDFKSPKSRSAPVYFDIATRTCLTLRLSNDFYDRVPCLPLHPEEPLEESRVHVHSTARLLSVDGIENAMVSVRRLIGLKRLGHLQGLSEYKRIKNQPITGITVGDIVRLLDWELPLHMYPPRHHLLPHPQALFPQSINGEQQDADDARTLVESSPGLNECPASECPAGLPSCPPASECPAGLPSSPQQGSYPARRDSGAGERPAAHFHCHTPLDENVPLSDLIRQIRAMREAGAAGPHQHADKAETTNQGERGQGETDQGEMNQGATDQGERDQGARDHGEMDQGATDQGAADQRATNQESMVQEATDQEATNQEATDSNQNKTLQGEEDG
ncbi:hypothetical protein HDK77DRAFT_113593 [Phyllosticta capitalensis]|uniref:Retrovirus-related Pol polyprotein from transposon TNT 1-94-like beta-barrel domain-containing protein n=1 Tax=Phyllosticta capitalensis TaxID=121624 RepID=A0ABR1YPN4_9PEZI